MGRQGTPLAEDLIVANPQILDGKPCIRGTRLSVEFLLELAASGAHAGTDSSLSIPSSHLMASPQRFGTPPMR
jgi:hypothetical protein